MLTHHLRMRNVHARGGILYRVIDLGHFCLLVRDLVAILACSNPGYNRIEQVSV